MKEIKNWNELEDSEVVSGGGLPVGIYPLRIVSVADVAEKEYLQINMEICKGEFKEYFKKLSDLNDGVWPNQGIWRASYKETATKFFKAFMTAIEKSNQNYKWNWDEKSLVGKYCYGVFAEEEFLTQENELKVAIKLREIRSVEAFNNGDIKVPPIKKLKVKPVVTQVMPVISDEEMPF